MRCRCSPFAGATVDEPLVPREHGRVTAPTSTDQRTAHVTPLIAAALDALLVIVFAAIGRASHSEALLSGLLRTAWPFLAGLAVGWLVVRLTSLPGAGLRAGLIVWICTVAGGMLLRALTGQGTAASFIVVASIVLGTFLMGWRVAAGQRRSGRSPLSE